MKKIFKFIIILLLWFLPSIIIKSNTSFYKNINLPKFAPPTIVFPIVWSILYVLISISIYRNKDKTLDYYKSLIINYFSNQIFTFLFFNLQSPFLALIDTVIVLISSLFLYVNSNKDKLLIPYIIWNVFATILISSIYFMNL